MSNTWDINNIRKIAGLPLMESAEEDDDLTPAERELAAKAESDLKKGGVKVPKVDPDKDLSKMAKKHKKSEEAKETAEEREEKESAAAKASEEGKEKQERKEVEKAAVPAKTAKKQERKEAAAKEEEKRGGGEEKKEEKKEEKPAVPAAKKAQLLRSWIEKNGVDRKGAWAYAQTIGLTPAGFSTYWQKFKSHKAATEAWVLVHPSVPNFLLAENREMGIHQWVGPDAAVEPLVFFKEKEAVELAKYLADWKNQFTTIQHVSLNEDEDEKEEPADKDALKKMSAGREWLKSNPEASREEFVKHMADKHGWASQTAHTSYGALKK